MGFLGFEPLVAEAGSSGSRASGASPPTSEWSTRRTVWRNAGAGAFDESHPYSCGDEPRALVAADLDRDGHLDLIAANHDGNFLSVLRSDGQGGFSKEVRLLARHSHHDLVAEYLDGDGDIDLAVANDEPFVSIYLNQSDRVSVIDCDENGTRDEFDLALSLDCNENSFPYKVDVATHRSADCDRNGIPDECQPPPSAEEDGNQNGIPDACERAQFHRGDPNDSGRTDISDAISILRYLFLGDFEAPRCADSGDANNDARLDISDAVHLLAFLFLGGAAPVSPGPPPQPCGFDPGRPGQASTLGCISYRSCGAI